MDLQNDSLTEAQLREKVMAKTASLTDIWARAVVPGSKDLDLHRISELQGTTEDRLQEMRTRDTEITDLKAQLDVRMASGKEARNLAMRNEALNMQLNEPVKDGRNPTGGGAIGIGDMFVRSEAYALGTNRNSNPQFAVDLPDYDVRNAVVSTGAGWDPPSVRLGRSIDSAQLRISLVDVVPTFPTGADTIRYMEETTYTATNVGEKAEAGCHWNCGRDRRSGPGMD